jgi:hypothetical protein
MEKYRRYKNNRYLTTKEELKIIESYNPTDQEMDELDKWILEGESFNSNPFMIYDENDRLSNFIEAYRFCEQVKEEKLNEQL